MDTFRQPPTELALVSVGRKITATRTTIITTTPTPTPPPPPPTTTTTTTTTTTWTTLPQDIDNQFFQHTTAGWPFSRLVDLASDTRLVKKPTLSVLYEEGETTLRAVGDGELPGEGEG